MWNELSAYIEAQDVMAIVCAATTFSMGLVLLVIAGIRSRRGVVFAAAGLYAVLGIAIPVLQYAQLLDAFERFGAEHLAWQTLVRMRWTWLVIALALGAPAILIAFALGKPPRAAISG
jgi:hypothetical protein